MRKKNKNIYICLIVLFILGISIGYAAINRTLDINGNSEVKKNTWNIHFENVQIKKGSVTATTEPTANESNPSIGFSFQLDLPGDFYEFTVDVINDGTIDAMIDSITKTPTLTTSQAKYLNYIIEYQNGEQITSKQLVKAGEAVRIKVRVEYRTDLNAEDLPTVTETLNLGFSINYVQADNTGTIVKDNGIFLITANDSLNNIGTIVTIGTEQFYTIGTDGDNIKLLSMYNLYVGNECTSNSYSSCTPYNNEATGMQDENMKGFVTYETVKKGTTEFSNDEQRGTYYNEYQGSIVEIYVNNYKTILENKYGIKVEEARLITLEELISKDLGCDKFNMNCNDAPAFIYSTSYWTMSNGSTTSYIEHVKNDSEYEDTHYSNNHSLGVRPVIVLRKNDIVFKNITPTANGSLDDIGTIVTIGSENFYTIGTEEDNVKLLSMYNLYVGNECISDSQSSCVPYGKTATGMQNEAIRGWVLGQNLSKGTTAFSSNEQKGINYSDYNGSIVEKYVNKYKIAIEKMDVEVLEARLITKDELTHDNIGCSIVDNRCSNAPDFIYYTTYWSGSFDNETDVWYVNSNGYFGNYSYSDDYNIGVRPVIVIPKSKIIINSKPMINFTVNNTTYQAEKNMTWLEWVNSEYNTDNFFIDSANVLSNPCTYILDNGRYVTKDNYIIDNFKYFTSNEPC